MAAQPRIAVDAMGGNGGPAVAVPAALALADRADIVLVGDAERLRAELARRAGGAGPAAALAIHPASQTINETDRLSVVLRQRPDSSMRQALLLHAAGDADAVVSAGATAALMALSRALLEMIPGIERPAICKDLQGTAGRFWMLDLGANLDCTPLQLRQFAHMGSTLARHVGGIDQPRVRLLNIGSEAGKGPAVLNEAARLLAEDAALHYLGFIEGNLLFADVADVVVADGFAGNIAVKSVEGAASMAGHLLRGWLDALEPREQTSLAAVRPGLGSLRHELNPQRYNGASFVGLSGVVVKSHGSADIEGFRCAIEEAILEVEGQVPGYLAAQCRPS